MAAFSKKNHYLLWSFVPLTGGILSLGFSFVNRKIFKSTALFTTGFLTFVLLAMVFLREARLLGSPFVPFSISGGLLYLANVLLSAGGIAGGVHLARRFPGTALSRWIMGVGGALFGSLTFIPVFAGKGHLSSWPMYLVYLLFFCYAGLGIAGATKTEPNDSFISFSGKTVRAIIPLALLG
ncbi:MAG: hypothetical protein GWN86_11590, partial [Desulfobacterales bacterium]|nr:hypothetical protein [Desulfobacterales bacterium]